MTKKKRLVRIALANAAKVLAAEIWNGKWEHLPGLHTEPIGKQFELARELERGYPGHSLENYVDAVAEAWYGH